MPRTRRFAALFLLLLLAMAVSAPEGIAQKKGKGGIKPRPAPLQVGHINHFELINVRATVTFVVTCPPGWRASAGFLTAQSHPSIRLIGSGVAKGGTAWGFTAMNTNLLQAVTAAVVVTCTRPPPPIPAARIKGARNAIIIKIAPLQQATGTPTCPKGQSPAGASVQQGAGTTPRQAQAAAAGGVGPVQITSVLPDGRSMTFGVRNPTDAEEQVTVGVNCLKRSFRFRGEPRRIEIKQGFFDLSVPPGDHQFTARCSGGALVYTGFGLPPDGRVSFFGASPQREGTTLSFGNHTVQAEPVKVGLVCASGSVKFVRQV